MDVSRASAAAVAPIQPHNRGFDVGRFGVPILFIFHGCIGFFRFADKIGAQRFDAHFWRIAAAFDTAFVHRHCWLAVSSVAPADARMVGGHCGIIDVFGSFSSIFYVSEQNGAAKIHHGRLEHVDFKRRSGMAYGLGQKS